MFLWYIFGLLLSAYAFALNRRLVTPNPAVYAYEAEPSSDEELAKVVVPTPEEMAEAIKSAGPATGKAYVIVGGSGFVGQYIVRTLLGRGEKLVRIVDVVPPKPSGNASAPDHISRAEFIHGDVTNYASIKEAISKPFDDTGRTVEVIFHTVAVIRFYERLWYMKHLSHRVNVEGTRNVLRVAQELGTVDSFVFTSSGAVLAPPPMYLRLGYENGLGPRNGVVFGEYPAEGASLARNHYADSKREADALVRAADGIKGVRTGVLRPGMTIAGPQDFFISVYLENPEANVVWCGKYIRSMVNSWDLARVHVQLADALSIRPQDVAGQAFAITGQQTAHSFDEIRRMIQFYSHRDLRFRGAPALVIYTLSHIIEAFLLARYLFLKSIAKVTGIQATFIPRWAMKSKLAMLQPTTWDLSFVDAIIDDSRARKVLGYRNYWSTAQTIRWTVDSIEGRLNR